MNKQELEDLYIRSLDVPMSADEKDRFMKDLHNHPDVARELANHKKVREFLQPTEAATFGPFFASKIIYKIKNTGVVIDRQLFSFFKKFQLAAAGVVVALLILNIVFSDEVSVSTVFGLNETTIPDEEIVSFDFSETLNTVLYDK